MAALYCLLSRLFQPLRFGGFLVAWCAFWACLVAPMSAGAEELPPGVLDLGTDPNTGIRRFKVGLGDVFGILGTPRYPSEAARQYLAETGEPLTVTVIQAQNPDRVLLSCFNEKMTRIERRSVRPGDYGPWESCPPERRHLTPSGGTIISLQMKKVPSPDRVKEIGNAAFAAFAANNPVAFAAVLLAQEEWFGKGSRVAAAFNGEAVKELAVARTEIAELKTAFTAERARAEAAEAGADRLRRASVGERARMTQFAIAGAVSAALAVAVLLWRLRSVRRRFEREREALSRNHREAYDGLEGHHRELLASQAASLAEAGEVQAALRVAFAGRPAPTSPRLSEQVDALAALVVTTERREVDALGQLAQERDRNRDLNRTLGSARNDARRLVAMVGYLREALASLIASLVDLRAMADPALLEASRGEHSSLPPPSLPAPPANEGGQDLYRAVLGRVPVIRDAIRRFNALLGTIQAELPLEGVADPGPRDREILAELRRLEDRQVDPRDEYQGIIRMLYEAKGAVKEMQRLEREFRPVVEAWIQADACLNGTPLALSSDWSSRPWNLLVADLGPPIERLMHMQIRLDGLERSVARGNLQAPAPRPSHQTDIAELSAQGIFDRILRDAARLLDTLNREPPTVCVVHDRGAMGSLMDVAMVKRYRLSGADQSPPVALLDLLGFSGATLGRPAAAAAMAE